VSRLTELLAQLKKRDLQLGEDLEREFKVLASRRSFGLNFERHRPEAVELPQRPVRRGDKVRVLPERGSTKKGDQRIWTVKSITKNGQDYLATISLLFADEPETQEVPVDDLVVVAEFQDYIYPGLVSTGKVDRGGGKPLHNVINVENYHALKALAYTHRGKVDAIYIDPPYNTRDKDWKYNNDYVDSDDIYKHSKWLAMMERRLRVASQLLNPQKSVLIVTIDEKEVYRLGLLLEQLFPGNRIQMISSMINPKGSARGKEFYRVDEYIFFIYFGSAVVQEVLVPGLCVSKTDADVNGDTEKEDSDGTGSKSKKIRWASLLRSGSGAQREESHLKFYPVLVDLETAKIVGAGDPLHLSENPEDFAVPNGLAAIWPIRQDGSQGRWQLRKNSFDRLLKKGYVKIGTINSNTGKVTFYYLMEGQRKKLASGEMIFVGKDQYGGIEIDYAPESEETGRPKTQWASKLHSATDHGTSLLRKVIPGRKFPFPKSLYAVEDTLRFFVADNKEAVILDFFAGSGTTAHAVMRLNKQDGGRRQSISVTNNEVAAGEQSSLRKKRLRPGDPDWESRGICEFITKPRLCAAITGVDPEGKEIQAVYSGFDEFPMSAGFEESAEFFTLTYESPLAINHNLAFQKISPLLWMRAGSQGKRIENVPEQGWRVVETYGLLTDLDQTAGFCDAVTESNTVRITYIVTNDDRRFQAVSRRLPDHVEAVRLYESYTTNFKFTSGD